MTSADMNNSDPKNRAEPLERFISDKILDTATNESFTRVSARDALYIKTYAIVYKTSKIIHKVEKCIQDVILSRMPMVTAKGNGQDIPLSSVITLVGHSGLVDTSYKKNIWRTFIAIRHLNFRLGNTTGCEGTVQFILNTASLTHVLTFISSDYYYKLTD